VAEPLQHFAFQNCLSFGVVWRAMDKVLLIDDENAILSFLHDVLINLGYEVEIAHDGKEGVALFKDNQDLDLVITDIRMPRMNGNAVAKYIRSSDRPHIPIVAISGFGNEIKRELFDFSIPKPFNLQALVDAIKTLK
jgi:CheY-like chemotaxis protein